MAPQNSHWLRHLIIAAVILVLAAGFILPALTKAREPRPSGRCLNNCRQIGLAMIQYATDHDDDFMVLATGEGNETVPAVDPETGEVSSLPSRNGFAVLLQRGYITGYKILNCPFSRDEVPTIGGNYAAGEVPVDPHRATLADCILPENCCSYGWDITKSYATASPNCAILADKPSDYVVDHYASLNPKDLGTKKHNSDNHRGDGQFVYYNDGHVKRMTTSESEGGVDPDIYVGAPGYEASYTDARIIR